jgi:AraC family transcriptional regulator
MNYRKDFERCLEYIELNITNPLNPTILAENIGYSLFHFCRLFQIYKGMSVMEYIRKRKLEISLIDIMNKEKIIDVALKYGFETPSGFTKAFRKEYGTTPKKYAFKMEGYNHKKPVFEVSQYIQQPKIVEISAFKIAGFGIETDIASLEYTNKLVAYWNDFEEFSYEETMYEALNPLKHGEIGISIPNSRDSGKMVYLCGVMVENEKYILNNMISFTIPEGQYAVFTIPPVDMRNESDNFAKMIKMTCKYVFDEWFSNCDYVFDEERYDFEFYDERCHYLENSTMDIYIPVKIAN